MNCLKEWIGTLAEKALNHVVEHGISTTCILGRKGRVTYEDDGSNLRASVVEVGKEVQIVEWNEDDSSRTEALLSDSYTKIRSIFSGRETSAFKRRNGNLITNDTKGGILMLHQFQVVVSRTVKPQISLYIERFELLGCEGTAVFGNPCDIHKRRGLMPLIDHFKESDATSVRRHKPPEDSSGHDQSRSSLESELNSQAGASPSPCKEAAVTNGVLDSGEGISTQAPPPTSISLPSFQPKAGAKEILQHLTSRPNGHPAKNTEPSIQNQTHLSDNTKGDRQPLASTTLREPGSAPRRISASSSKKQPVAHAELPGTNASSRSNPTTNEGLRPEPISTPSNLKRKNSGDSSSKSGDLSTEIPTTQSGTQLPTPTSNPKTSADTCNRASPGLWRWKKRIESRDIRIPKDQEELLDNPNSFVPPEPGRPIPHRHVPSAVLQEWDGHPSIRRAETEQPSVTFKPSKPMNINGKPRSPIPWRRTKIRLSDVRIPKDQQELIDSDSSWVPPHTGDRMPQGHVPIHLLQQWNGYFLQRNEEPLGQPSLPTGKADSEGNGSEECILPTSSPSSQVTWSPSPERSPPHRTLPPDSSSPEKQQQPLPDKGSSMGSRNTPTKSPGPMQLHNASGQIRRSSWSCGDDAQAALSNTSPDKAEDESDCEMDTSIPVPLEPQTQPQDLAEVEEFTSSGPNLPAEMTKHEPLIQVSQSSEIVPLGSHRNGCSGVSSQCNCPLKNPSSSNKSSDPRVTATCYTSSTNNSHRPVSKGNSQSQNACADSARMEIARTIADNHHESMAESAPQPGSQNPSQVALPMIQVFETPLNPTDSAPRLLSDQVSQLDKPRSKTQSPKRNREDAPSPFETPSKRQKSVDYLWFDRARKSTPEELSDAIADRRKTYIDQKTTSRNTQDIFNKFKQSYPQYSGNVKHFTSMCRKLQALRNQGKLERSFLWDDFIIHQGTDYREYIDMCIDAAEDPDKYEIYFLRTFTKPSFRKRSLTAGDIQTVLTECGDPAAVKIRTASTTPFSVSSQSHKRPNGTVPASSAGTPISTLETPIANETEGNKEGMPLEIKETQLEVPQPSVEANESMSDLDDEDEEEAPGQQALQDIPREDDYDDREIPNTPMEDLHETASVELGDHLDDLESQSDAAEASTREQEETFSDHVLEFGDTASATLAETPKGPRARGDSAAIPIEIESSLESTVNKGNDTPQESLDLDDVVGVKKDYEELFTEDGSDRIEDEEDKESDKSYHDYEGNEEDEEEDQGNGDDANAGVRQDYENENDRVSPCRSSRPSRSPRASPSVQSTSKHSTANRRQVLIPRPSPDRAPSPAKTRRRPPPSPKEPPKWHELPNTPVKLFAQSYANLRSELGNQPSTHWTKQKGIPERKRTTIPVDEKGVTNPALQKHYRNQGKVFGRGEIGWSFK